ncbi:MAG TPA: carboxypeptidase-like regulatory domain-containing protein [Acidobacteriaceae bacterium]|nr:carboxypeptidase-like regulatory domain-containing protein [Acidobacteriaceae bacterium]
MNRGSLRRCLLLAAAGLLLVPVAFCQTGRGRKYKPPPPTCNITVTVVRAEDGKPVENAAVVFHPVKDGKDKGNMELRTNEHGQANLNLVPVGDTLLLQVIADGFRTFGEEYPLPDATKTIEVKLQRPVSQYSIYQNHPQQGQNQNNQNQNNKNSGNKQQGSGSTSNPQ